MSAAARAMAGQRAGSLGSLQGKAKSRATGVDRRKGNGPKMTEAGALNASYVRWMDLNVRCTLRQIQQALVARGVTYGFVYRVSFEGAYPASQPVKPPGWTALGDKVLP